jgi:hypothetical protein
MESSTLTKEIKHAIYVDALKSYIESIKKFHNFGLCAEIRDVLKIFIVNGLVEKDLMEDNDEGIPEWVDPYLSLDAFPEIQKHKPEITYDKVFWFSLDETKKRIKIFKQAIEETK